MILEIEFAKDYYLCPLLEDKKVFHVGNIDSMNHLASLMDDEDIVSTMGTSGVTCYLLVDWDSDKCMDMLKRMSELMEARASQIVEGQIVDDQPKDS